ncbi:hypothetical protein PFICI_15218 [Pestalotiopsis fici W106-1]|uniref:SMP-30/Gluconolactonase/LRE-like region domain-containing protein n=1 Tax=Pestalotiopsis fici (strain W106-1 / CGMCC3.15140) TaxID=1229662 RepID=W3WGK6_PESFW|nr:uncharacterized protein PFICI_15218 [Pestalotiopsis fici W106-1]ETS73043.1 hypothetical protein PFICI_15218 [Pestalotiopsis fici W106-1]
MPGFILKLTAILVVGLGALLYQAQLPRMISLALGLGQTSAPLSAYPYTCRRLHHERLKACEDMWLSEATRQLFLACSDPLARSAWAPSQGSLDVSGRSLNDAIIVIDVDDLPAGPDVTRLRVLSMPGFAGTNGDGLLNVAGFGATDDDEVDSIRLWIVNERPSLNLTNGEISEQSKYGANTTIELFRAGPRANHMEHLKTFSHEQIVSPNRIAPVGGRTDAFYFTNDHGTAAKVGWRHQLSPILGTGDVSFCDGDACRQVVPGQKFPNGLIRGRDGLIYVPSSLLGTIDVYQPQPGGDLVKLHTIETGYAIDNLSPDRDGQIFAAAITNAIKFFAAINDPYNKDTPTAGLRITKDANGGYKVTKVVEDGLGEVLPGSTTVVHDATTGRIFFSGVVSPYIAVCDRI